MYHLKLSSLVTCALGRKKGEGSVEWADRITYGNAEKIDSSTYYISTGEIDSSGLAQKVIF